MERLLHAAALVWPAPRLFFRLGPVGARVKEQESCYPATSPSCPVVFPFSGKGSRRIVNQNRMPLLFSMATCHLSSVWGVARQLRMKNNTQLTSRPACSAPSPHGLICAPDASFDHVERLSLFSRKTYSCCCSAGNEGVILNHPLWFPLRGPLASFPHSLPIAPARIPPRTDRCQLRA